MQASRPPCPHLNSCTGVEQLYGGLARRGETSGAGLLYDLDAALKKGEPKDPLEGLWHRFDAMEPGGRPWDLERVRQEGRVQGERVLALWRTRADNDEPRDADTLRTYRDRPGRWRF